MENYLVVRREYDDNDNVVDTHPEMRITSIPKGRTIKQIKDILTQAGHNFQCGFYTVLAEENWYPIKDMVEEREYGERSTRLLFYEPGMDVISYDELLDKLNDEKRITLRLPNALHYALSQAARKITLNSYCIKILSDAVGYGERLEEFEAQRRKPGRPKKVQDSE